MRHGRGGGGDTRVTWQGGAGSWATRAAGHGAWSRGGGGAGGGAGAGPVTASLGAVSPCPGSGPHCDHRPLGEAATRGWALGPAAPHRHQSLQHPPRPAITLHPPSSLSSSSSSLLSVVSQHNVQTSDNISPAVSCDSVSVTKDQSDKH